MQLDYEQVPNIITGKDLDYLSDMFNWNFISYKQTICFLKEIKDENLVQNIKKASDVFYQNMQKIIDHLGGINE